MPEDLKNNQHTDPIVTGQGGNDPAQTKTAQSSTDPKPDFNELLKNNREYQSAFDRQVQNAIATARDKWEEDAQQQQSEAEKLAKMNAAEKEKFKIDKEWEKITAKQKELETRELKSAAVGLLAEKGLSHELAACLDYSSAESCQNSIEAVNKAVKAEVERQVNERFRSAPPKDGKSTGTADDFKSRYEEAKKNGNTLEMIRIKTEAANKGKPID